MFLPFEVDQHYMLTIIPTENSPGFYHAPGWVPQMAKFKGVAMKCLRIDELDDYIGHMAPYDNLDDEYAYHRNWMVKCKAPIIFPKCVCPDIWSGCGCGAFRLEMSLKGRVFNPITKLWVPK